MIISQLAGTQLATGCCKFAPSRLQVAAGHVLLEVGSPLDFAKANSEQPAASSEPPAESRQTTSIASP